MGSIYRDSPFARHSHPSSATRATTRALCVLIDSVIEDARQRITIAIAAIGGQGGAVLADWLVDIGESNGYFVQSTSVPGVAQRTGTTIYYLEMFPEVDGLGTPVMALMPVAGDVDIVVAAELAEAGRAVQRGIVTPDRTTLIASDHRYYAL
jgi:indolepyruvate ferredoxin oxidoreductase, beta subunit